MLRAEGEGRYKLVTRDGEFIVEPRGDGLHVSYITNRGKSDHGVVLVDELSAIIAEIGQQRLTAAYREALGELTL